jgi:hypothetical protein
LGAVVEHAPPRAHAAQQALAFGFGGELRSARTAASFAAGIFLAQSAPQTAAASATVRFCCTFRTQARNQSAGGRFGTAHPLAARFRAALRGVFLEDRFAGLAKIPARRVL